MNLCVGTLFAIIKNALPSRVDPEFDEVNHAPAHPLFFSIFILFVGDGSDINA